MRSGRRLPWLQPEVQPTAPSLLDERGILARERASPVSAELSRTVGADPRARNAMFAPNGHSALDRAGRGDVAEPCDPANWRSRSESHSAVPPQARGLRRMRRHDPILASAANGARIARLQSRCGAASSSRNATIEPDARATPRFRARESPALTRTRRRDREGGLVASDERFAGGLVAESTTITCGCRRDARVRRGRARGHRGGCACRRRR